MYQQIRIKKFIHITVIFFFYGQNSHPELQVNTTNQIKNKSNATCIATH